MRMVSHRIGSAVLIRPRAAVLDFLQFHSLILSPIITMSVSRGGPEEARIQQHVKRVREGTHPWVMILGGSWGSSMRLMLGLVSAVPVGYVRVSKGKGCVLLIAASSALNVLRLCYQYGLGCWAAPYLTQMHILAVCTDSRLFVTG